MYAIKLPDGKRLENLEFEDGIFTAKNKIDFGIFEGNLHDVEITSSDPEQQEFCGTHRLLKLTKILNGLENSFWVYDANPKDLQLLELQGQVAYLSMMSDIDLPA